MAILHTPRTIAAIARGLYKRRQRLSAAVDSAVVPTNEETFLGLGGHNDRHHKNAHVYKSRLNILWDSDYLGHMNNAAYLTHAEYARWEWTVENGALSKLYNQGMHFMVTHTAVRFRKEIAPFRTFEIHTSLRAIDDRHLWMQQVFRSKSSSSSSSSSDKNEKKKNHDGRILAQVLVQAVAVKNRKVLPPSAMLEAIGVSEDVVDSLRWNSEEGERSKDGDDDDGMAFIQRFKEMDEAFREEAASDDERLIVASKGE